MKTPLKFTTKICLIILSAVFLFAEAALAGSPPLTATEKAMVHVMLGQTQSANMQEEGRRMYNYSDPTKSPYANFKNDIEPWIAMGARRSDSPNPKGRIKAYISDVGSGITEARALWPTITEAEISNYAKKDIPQSWEKTLSDEKARNVLGLINGDLELTDKTLKKSLKAVRKEFRANY